MANSNNKHLFYQLDIGVSVNTIIFLVDPYSMGHTWSLKVTYANNYNLCEQDRFEIRVNFARQIFWEEMVSFREENIWPWGNFDVI